MSSKPPHPSYGNLSPEQIEMLTNARWDQSYQSAKDALKKDARVRKKRAPKLLTDYIFKPDFSSKE